LKEDSSQGIKNSSEPRKNPRSRLRSGWGQFLNGGKEAVRVKVELGRSSVNTIEVLGGLFKPFVISQNR